MYNTSKGYKEKVLEDSTQHELNIYIDENKIEPNHIIDFSSTSELFNNNEFCLGCTPERDIEFEIDKRDLPETYNEVYVETGIKYHEDIVTEGEELTLKEEKEIPLNMEISGNSEQETRSDKNLVRNENKNVGDNSYWYTYSTYDKETYTMTRSTTATTESFIAYRIGSGIIKNNTQYTISFEAKKNEYVKSFEVLLIGYNATGIKTKTIDLTNEFKKYSYTFTTDATADYKTLSQIRFDNNGSTENGKEAILNVRNVMLVEGTDTDFEQYGVSPSPDYPSKIKTVGSQGSIKVTIKNDDKKEQSYIIPTQQPLRAIEDTRDTFIKKNNKWYERHYIGKFNLNSNATFNKYASSSNNAYYTKINNFTNQEPVYPKDNSSVAQILCTHGLKTYVNDIAFNKTIGVGFTFENTKEVWIGFGTSGPSTVDELKTWLIEQENAGTPVEIYYVLQTPTDIECTEEQSKILEELTYATTYEGTTHIYSTDMIKPKLKTTVGGETVPIGHFIIQKPIEDDEFKVKIKATDYMKMFEDINYDGSNLAYPKTMLEVLKDICEKVGVELGSTFFLNSDKQIAVYDNTVTARTYLGYIAEQAGGFAVIGRDGKLYIKTFGENIADFDINLFGDFTWGDKFKVSKVSYEDGIQDYKFGDETQATVYIDQNNMYIVDKEQVENIYNQIKEFEIYTFEGETIIDPAYDVGDILIIDGKRVLYQGDLKYAGKFKANIKNKIQAKTEQESMQTKQSNSNKIKRVQSEINQIDGKITQLVQETSEHEEKITQAQQDIDGFIQKVATKDELTEKVNELKHTIEGITLQVKETGGGNIFFYAKEYWKGQEQDSEATLEEYTNTLIQQNNVSDEGYLINNGISIQSQVVKNGQYVISFNYYKLKEDATGYVKVNETEYKLDGNVNTWIEKVIPIEITSNNIKIEIGSDTVASYYISDLMVSMGVEKAIWQQNANETRTDTVEIGKGIQVNSSTKNTYTRIDADGNRTFNSSTNERVAEMTDKGVYTKQLEVNEQAKINSLLIQKIGNQIWLTGLEG